MVDGPGRRRRRGVVGGAVRGGGLAWPAGGAARVGLRGGGSHRREGSEEVSFCVGEGMTWRGPPWLLGFD
jgi:hypothetical protein